MSRSIHATRQTLAKARRQNYADPSLKAATVRRERLALNQKRRIKRQMRRASADARQTTAADPVLDGTPVDVATIAIETAVEGDPRFVHPAASPEDLRALLAALPPGTADGLSRITSTLGKRYIAGSDNEEWLQPDPLTGRIGSELFRGVYDGAILGVYLAWSAGIRLHAYVYDPKKLPLPRPWCELYLRLQALVTFVHELAHHFDYTRRVARGRWLARGKQCVEQYAEAREYAWGREYVVPLLRRLYPEEARGLEEWIAHHGGLQVPLEWLVPAPVNGTVERQAAPPFDLRTAFESWLDDVETPGSDLFVSRHNFAWALHYADQYTPCLQAIDRLLADFSPTAELWSFRADTLVHLERWDEATTAARHALDLDPLWLDAWEQLGWVAANLQDWPELLANTRHRLSLINSVQNRAEWFITLFHRAIALCGLGEFARMEACLVAGTLGRAHLARRRKRVYRWAGFDDQTKTF